MSLGAFGDEGNVGYPAVCPECDGQMSQCDDEEFGCCASYRDRHLQEAMNEMESADPLAGPETPNA